MTSEPRVEELLAQIRRAIDHDINELDRRAQDAVAPEPVAPRRMPAQAMPSKLPPRARPEPSFTPPAPQPASPLRGTLNEFRDRYTPDADADIAKLRQRVKHNRFEDPPMTPPPPNAQRTGSTAFSAILSEPSPPEPVYDEAPPEGYEHYQHPQQQTWQGEPQGYYQPPAPQGYAPQQPGLMSADPSYAAQSSFQALAELAMAQVGGPQGLQHMTREVLVTLLREWLDRNLPPLVEALVREEIERVGRGRR